MNADERGFKDAKAFVLRSVFICVHQRPTLSLTFSLALELSVELTTQHQQLLELASRVPEEQIPAAKRILEALIVDPLWLALAAAPMDDEELTPEVIASIEEARASIARGEGISHEEILREFGLG